MWTSFPRWWRDVADFCYPALCAACRDACPSGSFLCSMCEAGLCTLENQAACESCAMPLALEGSSCPRCRGNGVAHYDRIIVLGRFAEPLAGLVHHVKYHGRWPVAEDLADRLLKQERVRLLLDGADRLLPVPLYWLRQAMRGYNQAEVIAARLARVRQLRVIRPIVRHRHTPTQTRLSKAERFKNLQGAFRLRDAASVRGQHIVVIDDVTTTGATLQTLARILRPAKPASLDALLLAAADPRGRDFQVV